MVNYNNGKIYMIRPIVEHEDGEVYIGSTTKHYLSDRLFNHRNVYKMYKVGKGCGRYSVYDLFDKYGPHNCDIYLIESVNANSKAELFTREGHHIKNTKCVNKIIPITTREEMLQKKRESNYRNIETIKKYNHEKSVKENCDCGGCYTLQHKNAHMKTKKHLSFLFLQSVNANSKCELLTRECSHITACEEILQTKKESDNNKIETIKNNSQIFCVCGGCYTSKNKTAHMKTNKHLSYLFLHYQK
jgi:hypothetical protein